jgi:Xaa-Pro aminopeptidase
VVQLVFPDEQHPDDKYAITYERGENPNKPDGVLSSGNSVKIKEGMVFVVSPTGQS